MSSGRNVASGVYMVRVSTGKTTESTRLVKLR
jgi:hypothetical protein